MEGLEERCLLSSALPTAQVTGPATGYTDSSIVFAFNVADPSPADQAADFQYKVSWGDGATQTITGPNGLLAGHRYTDTGSYTIQLTATDHDGATSAPATFSTVLRTSDDPEEGTGQDYTPTHAVDQFGTDTNVNGGARALNIRWYDNGQRVSRPGQLHEGDRVRVYFDTAAGAPLTQFSLVAYAAPNGTFDSADVSQEQLWADHTVTVSGAGHHYLTVDLPNGYFQVELVRGAAIKDLSTGASYQAEKRLVSGGQGGDHVVPPGARVTGEDEGVTNHAYAFALWAADAFPANQAAGFTYSIAWGDGSTETVTGPDGVKIGHAYTADGEYTISVTAADQQGATSSVHQHTIDIDTDSDDGSGGGQTGTGSTGGTGGTGTGGTGGTGSSSLATPTLAGNATSGGVVGSTPLNDTVAISGGSNPTGTITFTLQAPDGSRAATETVTVQGDGSYGTPNGILPTQVGTYTWSASYSGDALNNAAADDGQNQTATVSQTSPTLVPSAGPGGVVGTASLTDSVTLSGGFNPTGTITFTLQAPDGSSAATETVTVQGNGTYTAPNGVPAAQVGTYTWSAQYSGDTLNRAAADNGQGQSVTVSQAGPTLASNAGPGGVVGTATLTDSVTLSGGSNPTGTITFVLQAPDGSSAATATVAVQGNGTYSTPNGVLATQVGTYTWSARYSGDTLNSAAADNGQKQTVSVSQATPTLVSSAGPGGVVGTATLTDSVTLSGGFNPTGTITFTLQAPEGSIVATETVAVQGNGTYSTPSAVLATRVGTYTWSASYSGDGLNKAAVNHGPNNTATTTKAGPSLSVAAGQGSVVAGTTLTASATLSGGYQIAGGTITFTLTAPDGTTAARQTVPVTGAGTYTAPTGVAATQVGIYTWTVSYSGDALNQAATGQQGAGVVVLGKVQHGDFGGIGFWHNKNGQGVINAFNGGPNATGLGTWLASTFPNLFGTPNALTSSILASLPGQPTTFAGLTNAQVAAVYLGLWPPSGATRNAYVHAFAAALSIYATTSSLGGQSLVASGLAGKYGLHVTRAGSGNDGYAITASNAAAFGTSEALSAVQIMQTVSNSFNPATGCFYGGDDNVTNAASNVLDGIGQGGGL